MPINNDTSSTESPAASSSISWLKLIGMFAVATTIATMIAVWAITSYIFPAEIKPVKLSSNEEQTLNEKLERLDSLQQLLVSSKDHNSSVREDPLKPQPYKENVSKRQIVLSEKELNALLARNTDLAKKLAIDLSDDLASAKLLLPMDEDFPILGGKTLKVEAGLELAYGDGKPIVMLKGVSILGVPLPNAWLGNLKNVDLVKEFGGKQGFWNAFAAGIGKIEIAEGKLRIHLKE